MSAAINTVLPAGGVALVTGGARGLGLAVALSFAREGCSGVTIVDVLPDDILAASKAEIEAAGAKCLALKCDVTKEDQIEQAVAATVKQFGRLDYAANAAGITGQVDKITETDTAQFERLLQVNVLGVILCTKHQIRQMETQEPVTLPGRRVPQRGAIVNFASVNSVLSGAATGAYTASKHAVHGLTKTEAALENRSKHIRVNCVSPGWLWTDLVSGGLEASQVPEPLRAFWAGVEDRQGRKAFAEEIGDSVVMLCSPKQSLVNGHNLMCDNGFCIYEGSFDFSAAAG